MMSSDGMMTSMMVGTGWLGLMVCLVGGAIARIPLGLAGRRRAEGTSWGGWGAVGFGLLAVALVAGLSSLGSFFGIIGIGFVAVTALGGAQAFFGPARAVRARQEQIAHAERMGQAWRGGGTPATSTDGPAAASSGTLLNGEPLPGPADPRPVREPEWYASDEPDRGEGRDDEGRAPRA